MEASQGRTSSHSNKKREMEMDRTHSTQRSGCNREAGFGLEPPGEAKER
jgi:hypothetical protein